MTDAATLVMTALEHAYNQDTDRALATLQTLAEEHGDAALFGAPAAFAVVAVHVLERLHPLAPGEMWAIGSLVRDIETANPASVFAARYVVATANRQADHALALLRAEASHPDDDRFPRAVLATLGLAASLMRAVLPKDAQ
ncbi:hypothetical protein B4N89_27370 [Embleya scabrispora]|uniref:Uncharacterized protein n=1 Tax=Embleya scabrispora TaxID=159449 RepID=A0A1T3P5J0_9ACTN|nr:hypothetical protein [Embleya scabrispora]OPC84150.1 hypothetical protein B4N89_27370 [Embleya scabrispora]